MSKREELPPLLLEQLALGELDPDAEARVRAELEALDEGDGRDRLAELDADTREILADYPPERLAAAIRRRADRGGSSRPKPGRSRGWFGWVALPTALAAIALVWVITRDEEQATVARTQIEMVDDGQPEKTRIKGGVEPHLVVDRRTTTGHERLDEGELAAEGDLLQLSYVAAGRTRGVILSLDGAGVVTLHHPPAPTAPPLLEEGSEVPLAHAYELDDAPGFERFVFVTREGQAPDVASVLAAAEALAADPQRAATAPLELAGSGWQQSSLLLRKHPAAAERDGEAEDSETTPRGGP